jgi:hypothetical protein
MSLIRYCGYDASEKRFRGRYGSRWTAAQIDQLKALVKGGATGKEVAAALDLKVQAVRAKCSALGLSLRRKIKASRVRMLVYCTAATYAAADARSISVQVLVRRLLAAISKADLFDELLPLPQPRSLGAAATSESKPPVVILRCPQLAGAISPVVLR